MHNMKMKNKKRSNKNTDQSLYKAYRLNLQPVIEEMRDKNKISVEKNKEALLEMLKKAVSSNESSYLIYLILAKCKIDIPTLYYKNLRDPKLKSSLEKKNNLPSPIDEKKLDHLSDQIRKFEEEVLPPMERELLNLLESHRIPSRFWSLLKNLIIYGDFGDTLNMPNLTDFEYQNLWINYDGVTGQMYVEIRLYGDTAKREVLNNWPIISRMQKRLPDYRSSKSKIRSQVYNKIADKVSKGDNIEDVIDDYANAGKKGLSDVKNYKNKLKKLKTQERRRKKHFNL